MPFFFFLFSFFTLCFALEHFPRSHVNWVAVSGNVLVINYPSVSAIRRDDITRRHAREDGERLSVKPGCNAPPSCNGIGEQDPFFVRGGS